MSDRGTGWVMLPAIRMSRNCRTHFGIRVEFNLADSRGHHAFAIGAKRQGRYEIQREECHVVQQDGDDPRLNEEEHADRIRQDAVGGAALGDKR